jgi:hypothetical protein
MLLQSILSTITYSRPVTSAVAPPKFKQALAHLPTHSSLALLTLRTLSHLSFVITKFGGVVSTSSDGFAELKQLSTDVETSEKVVQALCLHDWTTWILRHDTFTDLSIQMVASSGTDESPAEPLTRACQAFNLGCVGQLVLLLGLDTIEHCVFPLCLP